MKERVLGLLLGVLLGGLGVYFVLSRNTATYAPQAEDQPQRVKFSTYNKTDQYCLFESIDSLRAANETVIRTELACDAPQTSKEKEECLQLLSKNQIALTMMESYSCTGGTEREFVPEPSPTSLPKQSVIKTTTNPSPSPLSSSKNGTMCTSSCEEVYSSAKSKCVAFLPSSQGSYAACLGRIGTEKETCMQGCR